MSMNLETKNKEAFRLVNDAVWDIDGYKRSKELGRLVSASEKLERAIQIDPSYMHALFYGAMVNDLIGKPKDATEQLERLLAAQPPFGAEIRYNLAVAYYHRYSHRYLEKAAEHFSSVISETQNVALELLARAGLAQTHAMWIIQPNKDQPNKEEALKHFNESRMQYELVLRELERVVTLDRAVQDEVRWTALNARGMSLMYYTDYFCQKDEAVSRLSEALGSLMDADKYSPNNWANYCDIGSAHMRLGYWLDTNPRPQEADGHFQEAHRRLEEVIESLRPGYGFALYEKGRVYRLMGDFDEAVIYFLKALEVNEVYRDVSNNTVNREKKLAEEGSRRFP